jgi:nitrite reductase/ring-hydroxylating ferredoxin subunit
LSEEDFVQVADTEDIPSSKMKEVQVDGENICVANVEGKILCNWQYLYS